VEVLQRRSRGTNDDHLAVEHPRVDPAAVDIGEGDRAHRAGGPREVDQRAVAGEPIRGDGPSGGLGGCDSEAPQADDAVRVAADHAARVRRHIGGGSDSPRAAEVGLAAEHVRPSGGADFGRRQHDVPGAADCREQGVVVGRISGLCELDVEGDHLRPVSAQRPDHGGVVAAG
jgi:hypothetical protein